MYLSLVLGALICAGINRMSIPGMMVQVCYSLILGVVFMTLLHAGQDMLWQQIPEKLIYLFSFSVALCLIGVASRYHVGMFILLPLAVVSRLDKLEIKVVTFGTLMMTYLCNAAFVNNDLGQMVYYLIMAVAFLMIVSMLQSREELPYAAVILTALCLALFVIRCRFQGSEMFIQRYYLILELGSLVFLALFCAILQLFNVHEPEEEVQEAPAQELDMFIYSLGIPNIGLSNAKMICNALDNNLDHIRHCTVEELTEIDGVGEVIARSFVEYFATPLHNKIVDDLLKEITFEQTKAESGAQNLTGLVFVITGSLEHFANRSALKECIENAGGKVTGSVTSKTSYLINNDIASTSSKNKKAKELNVPIITEAQVMEQFGLA